MPMRVGNLALATVEKYYGDKFKEHGADPAGVDWSSRQSQELRFEQLIKVCDFGQYFSLNDMGSGYGALYEFIEKFHGTNFDYLGYDICKEMIDAAHLRLKGRKNVQLFCTSSLEQSDYTLASGLFNAKLKATDEVWLSYVMETLNQIDEHSAKGFAFNLLSRHSPQENRKDYLYYAEPTLFFEWCTRKYSKNIALLHDYSLSEFTILVRK